jgi:hypothetical protein
MIFCPKLRRLVIACATGVILTLSIDHFLQIVNSKGKNNGKRILLNAKELNIIEFKVDTSGVTALHINENTGDIVMGMKNGEVAANHKLLFTAGKGKIDYIRKYNSFIYVASFEGVIRKYLHKEHSSNQSSLLGYYDCTSTIIGFEVYES